MHHVTKWLLVIMGIILGIVLFAIGLNGIGDFLISQIDTENFWSCTLQRIQDIGAAWRGEIPIETDSIAPFIDPIDDISDIIDTTKITTLGTSKVSEPHTGASQSTVARRSGTNGVIE